MSHSPERNAIKKLFALSGNECAFPKCNNKIVDLEYGTVVGEIAHIKGRHKLAARYDPSQTESERNAFGNLILLCPEHHKIIDSNPEKFTVERLTKMKHDHEPLIREYIELTEEMVDELLKMMVG